MSAFFIDGNGELVDLQGDVDKNLRVTQGASALEVQRGNVTGESITTKFGENPDIANAASYESIWNGGGEYTGFNATRAEIVEVFSGSEGDTGTSGPGAHTIHLFGLNEDWIETDETLTLSGTTPVSTVGSYIRMDRGVIRSAGGSLANLGEITARQVVATDVRYMVMPIGFNQTMICCKTIPGSKTGWIREWDAYLSGKVQANIVARLTVRPEGEVFQVKEKIALSKAGNSNSHRNYPLWKGPFNGKTDIKIEASADASNTGVSAALDMKIIDD